MPFAYKTDASRAERIAAWKSLDNSGNGYVSLAETGKWIQDTIQLNLISEATAETRGKSKLSTKEVKARNAGIAEAKDRAKLLYKRFYPCYIRAFLDAADIGKNKKVGGTKTATTDDYVQKHEFRHLAAYLGIYALMYDAFSQVDGGSANRTKDDDRRISKAELAKSRFEFKGHPLTGLRMLAMPDTYGNIDTAFNEMDADGKGKVLLKEWCQWLERAEVQAETSFGDLLTYASSKGEAE